MFTGIIEEIGQVKQISAINGGKRITIGCRKVMNDIAIDHSISVSGVCLTVVELGENVVIVEAVGETLTKSTLANLQVHNQVNLERAMCLGDRLGGHIVQGHVNGIGTISKKEKRGENWFLQVQIPDNLERYLISEGSIAINGISLTIATLQGNQVGLSIIPHSYNHTTVRFINVGNKINIEVDFMARHLEKLIQADKKSSLNLEKIKTMGY